VVHVGALFYEDFDALDSLVVLLIGTLTQLLLGQVSGAGSEQSCGSICSSALKIIANFEG